MTPSFLVVDKPPGITSHDVVAIVRAVTGVKKVGHTGTLDPFATGVLALALGGATRLVQFLDESIKVYDATIALGEATDTGDPTGAVVRSAPVPALEVAVVQEVLEGFLGQRLQRPPAYSAVKVKGKPLYWYARRGEEMDVEARPIQIHALELLELGPASLRVLITCSRGTYARVIADDVATALGTAGHLSALSRRRSGPFHLEDAISLPQLGDLVGGGGHPWQDVLMARGRREDRLPWRPRRDVLEGLAPHLRRPLDALPGLPLLDVDAGEAKRVRSGATPAHLPGGLQLGGRFLVVHGADVVAICEASGRGPVVLRVVAD